MKITKHCTYSVKGDHPTLKRPDKHKMYFCEAAAYAELLLEVGYENIEIENRP
jgi:hypothetical protein